MYCSKCGKEMPDDAVICTGCGCLLRKEVKADPGIEHSLSEKRQREANNSEKSLEQKSVTFNKALKILFIISLALNGITIFLFSCEVAKILFRRYNESFVIPLMFSVLSLGSAITEFIFSRKPTSEAMNLVSTMQFSAAIVMFLVSLRFCIG